MKRYLNWYGYLWKYSTVIHAEGFFIETINTKSVLLYEDSNHVLEELKTDSFISSSLLQIL